MNLDRPVKLAGAVYAQAAQRATRSGAYTQRMRFYALAWHSFRAGPDPDNYIKWNFVRPSIPYNSCCYLGRVTGGSSCMCPDACSRPGELIYASRKLM